MSERDEPLSYWLTAARMGFEDDVARLAPTREAEAATCATLESMAELARSVGGILQIRVIKEEGEVLRVVDYEAARLLDVDAAAFFEVPVAAVGLEPTTLEVNDARHRGLDGIETGNGYSPNDLRTAEGGCLP